MFMKNRSLLKVLSTRVDLRIEVDLFGVRNGREALANVPCVLHVKCALLNILAFNRVRVGGLLAHEVSNALRVLLEKRYCFANDTQNKHNKPIFRRIF